MALPYKCTSIGCYSYQSQPMNASIVALQHAINRHSESPMGFSPIAADGVFGKGSLAALLLVLTDLSHLGDRIGPEDEQSAKNFLLLFSRPEDVVQYLSTGPTLTMMLVGDANKLGYSAQVAASKAPPTQLPVPNTAAGVAVLTQLKANTPGIQGSLVDVFHNIPLWGKILGGTAFLGAIVFVATKKKKKARAALMGW